MKGAPRDIVGLGQRLQTSHLHEAKKLELRVDSLMDFQKNYGQVGLFLPIVAELGWLGRLLMRLLKAVSSTPEVRVLEMGLKWPLMPRLFVEILFQKVERYLAPLKKEMWLSGMGETGGTSTARSSQSPFLRRLM